MKVSDITVDNIKEYLRVDVNNDDEILKSILAASKVYVKNYTGLADEAINEKEDIVLVIYVLCNEMYDKRQYTVDKGVVNPIIKSMLDMHSVNLL